MRKRSEMRIIMTDGFFKVAVSTPELRVADCHFNCEQMIKKAERMAAEGVRLLAFPELSLTGYTCSDLFLHDTLTEGAQRELWAYARATAGLDMISVLGLPEGHGEYHQPDESQSIDNLWEAWKIYTYTICKLIREGWPEERKIQSPTDHWTHEK